MPLPRTPAFVRADGESWSVVERDTDEVLSEHPTARQALDALLALPGFERKGAILHDPKTKQPNGEWRWLDASAEQPEPGPEGAQVTADAIATMAARLNEGEPVMVDGGTPDSIPHDSADDPATRANGWAHVGAELVDPGGRTHLMLYAELLPAIAEDFDSGRLAKGSIFFSQVKSDRGDSTLHTHALLNRPAVKRLMPSTALALADKSIGAWTAPVRNTVMANKVQAKRGPAMDKLNELLALLKISPAEGEDYDPWGQVMQAVSALQGAAKVEAITEGGTPAPAAEGQRAEGDGMPGADAMTAAHSEMLTVLRDALGLPADADDAAVLTALKSVAEKIKGAIAAPAETPNPNPEGAMSESKEVRTELAAVRTDLTSVRAELSEIKAERDALKLEKRRADACAKVDARALAVKKTLVKDDRDWLIEEVLSAKDEKHADERLRRVLGPVQGEAMPETLAAPKTDPVLDTSAEAGTDGTRKALVAKELEAVLKEKPSLSKGRAFALAQSRVLKSHPELLRGTGTAGEE